MKSYKYILFDLDGTLTDPKEGITKSVAYALEYYGIHVEDLDSLCKFIGPPLKDSFVKYYGFEDAKDEAVLQTFLKESREESEAYLQAYITNMYPMFDYGIWAIECVEDGAVIGMCGLGNPAIDGTECTDLGYYICPKCRNQGIASECIEIVLDYAKNYLEIPVIYAIIKEENRISEGILRKFGFTYEKQGVSNLQKVSVYKKELTE